MYVYRVRSANFESALTWPAAAIQLRAGVYVFPNNDLARMRAGMAQDLDTIKSMRLSGDKAMCRYWLRFARDARLLMQRMVSKG